MARIKAISITIEVLESNSWRQLEEFETLDSLKEAANNAQRHTSAVQTPPGQFRLLITVHDTFEWADSNALQLLLTFDFGERVNKYQTVVLRPGKGACDLAEKLNLNPDAIMSTTRKNTAMYVLDSIGMPIDLFDKSWYRAEFAFEKLDQEKDVTSLPITALEQVDHMQIELSVAPCQVSPDRKRDKPIALNPERPDLLRNVFLVARLLYNPECPVDKESCYKAWCPPGSPKYSFVFLYSEVNRRKEIPFELIDYSEASVGTNSVVKEYKATSSTTSSNKVKPKHFGRQPPSLASSPSIALPKSPTTPQNRQLLPTSRSQNRKKASTNSPQKRLFGNTTDWNMVNGQRRSPIMSKSSSNNMVTPPPTGTATSSFRRQLQSSEESLSDIENEWKIMKETKREIRAEKLAERTRIRAAMVQNAHKLILVRKEISDTIKLLTRLGSEEDQLVREQDELAIQDIKLDEMDADLKEHSLSVRRSVQLWKHQHLQQLEAIRSNKRRRLDEDTPDQDTDTTAVTTPSTL